MSRVEVNWDRLVRAALRRDRGGADAFGRPITGIAGNVPSALANRDVDAILRAADEIQDEDANVSRICKSDYFFLFLFGVHLVRSFLLRFSIIPSRD